MTNPLELLSWLGPRSPHLHPVSGRGGLPGLTAQDVAAALAGCPKPAEYAALAKHLGGHRGTLTKVLKRRLLEVRQRRAWRDLDMVVDLAVAIYCSTGCCGVCGGTGRHRTDPVQECSACGGTGREKPSSRRIAQQVGIPRSTYHETWVPRIEIATQILTGWESEAAEWMGRRLRPIDANL